ncbi:TetR/AcrR family transcriptional regulator [Lysinibacillus sp. SGAir0095]|uniref:TetR/AcrR family transcriptional regulator n=1 Tax=Lysinibacillus sp. SGAir0095 TaxID=2070463 RepID=UPI0010CD2A1D|nr:TetR-like C-terminal domain-containing protein [Lysinibacillus sp. SGAir0095]QCR33373.1 TetR/AcrR family transcriptional regulator [Lysinibacillus sp. SGAir0095]
MSSKKEDPRAIRSKRLLKEAVISILMETQSLQELTVQKVTARAELNRATFYFHYLDMRDLMRNVVYDIYDDLSMKLSPLLGLERGNMEHLLTFLDYFYEHRKYLAVLFEEKAFQRKLHNFIMEFVQARRDALAIEMDRENVSKDIIAASILGILMWWIRDGKNYSSEYIAQQMSVWILNRT